MSEFLNRMCVYMYLVGSILFASVAIVDEVALHNSDWLKVAATLTEYKCGLIGTLAYLMGSIAAVLALHWTMPVHQKQQ